MASPKRARRDNKGGRANGRGKSVQTRGEKGKGDKEKKASGLSWDAVRTKVRNSLLSMRRKQDLVDVYSREYNAEFLKPEAELRRAAASIRRCVACPITP